MLKDIKTNCTFCSLGCGLTVRVDGIRPIELDYDSGNPINGGSLCPRGNYMFELLKNPLRLNTPRVKEGRNLFSVEMPKAIEFLAEKLLKVKKSHGADSIGVIIGSDRFNEEIFLTHKVCGDVLKTSNVDVAFPSEDLASLEGEDRKMPFAAREIAVQDIGSQDALLIIGDILVRSPVLSKRINQVKYQNKGKIIVVDPERSHTSWFATSHLRVKPGSEGFLLAGMAKVIIESSKGSAGRYKKYLEEVDLSEISSKTGVPVESIVKAARAFAAAKKAAVLVVSGYRDKLLAELSRVVAFVAGARNGVITFYSSGNSIGAFEVNNSMRGKKGLSANEMMDAASRGRLKGLLLIGFDPLRYFADSKLPEALADLEFLAVADMYKTRSMDYADVILPLSSPLEGEGSVVYSGKRNQSFDLVVPPRGPVTAVQLMGAVHEKIKGGKGLLDKKQIVSNVRKLVKSYKPSGRFALSRLSEELGGIETMKTGKKFPFSLYLKDDIVHSGDGSITSNHVWAKRECPSPYVEINSEDAKELGVSSGSRVLVRTDKSEIVLNAKTSATVARGALAAPHHFPGIRELVSISRLPTVAGIEVIG